MYHDFLGREIEDLEGDNMRRDWQEEQEERLRASFLFRFLDAVFAVLDLIRLFPWHVWYLLSCAYLLTIGRAIVHMQIKRNLKKILNGE